MSSRLAWWTTGPNFKRAIRGAHVRVLVLWLNTCTCSIKPKAECGPVLCADRQLGQSAEYGLSIQVVPYNNPDRRLVNMT